MGLRGEKGDQFGVDLGIISGWGIISGRGHKQQKTVCWRYF